MTKLVPLPRSNYFLALVAGLTISNVYFSQPVLPMVAESTGVSTAAIGYLPALTQFGYACGLVAFLPLADIVELRRLVAIMLSVVALMALAQGLAPTFPLLLIAGFFLGLVCVVPQLLTAYAAILAPKGLEGRSVGLVLSGILSGVLASKIIAGFLATALGWRAIYFLSALAMLLLAVLVRTKLPANRPAATRSYAALMRSTLALFLNEPALRRYGLNGALSFGAFMVFWSNYAVHLSEAFSYGSHIAGLFGFAGIAGILAAPLAGRLIDRGDFNAVCIASGVIMATAYLLILLAGQSIVLLVAGVVLLDAGMALNHTANQSSAFALQPSSRGRINAVYMSCYFVGGAAGTALGSVALALAGWPAVCAVGMAVAAAIPVIQLIAPIQAVPLPLKEI